MNKLSLFFTLFLFCLTTQWSTAQYHDNLMFSAKLDGAQAGTSASGYGVASLTANSAMDSICIMISTNGLSGTIDGIHIHEGAVGESGGVAVDLTSYVTGNQIEAKLAIADLPSDALDRMLMGTYYLNVHTAANPAGEIRGQIWLEQDWVFTARLDTASQTHTVTGSDGWGMGVIRLSKSEHKMWIMAAGGGMAGPPTAMHLHYGAPGTDGGVALDLTPTISMTSVSWTHEVSTDTVPGLVDSLKAGRVYVNLHTAANPAGEIRGDFWQREGITFTTVIDTAQLTSTPTVNSGRAPGGVGYMTINPSMDTLWANFVLGDLTGDPTAMHIHKGFAGTTGGVILDFGNVADSISDNDYEIMGTYTSSDGVNDDLFRWLLSGEGYVNIHTSANGGGETRGQVIKSARDGYNFLLTGEDQNPALTVDGHGSGIVSINTSQSDAHLMFVCADLTGANSGVHFHQGTTGTNGGVIYDLSSWTAATGTDDQAFGYWTDMDGTAFDASAASDFWNNGVYLNVHTTANAGGELRGQVRGDTTACMVTLTDVEQIEQLTSNFELAPNPTSGTANLYVTPSNAGEFNLSVVNVLGERLVQQSVQLTEGANVLEVDLTSVTTGIYYVILSDGKLQQTKKLIKR